MTLKPCIIENLPNDNHDFTMRTWLAIEFSYVTKKKIETDFCIAPLGSKEIDGRWYLFGFDLDKHLLIFDMANITDEIGFFFGIFSLPETLDFERIATQYFSPERVE